MSTHVEAPRAGDRRLLMLIIALGIQLALVGAYLGGRVMLGGGDSPGGAVASAGAPGPQKPGGSYGIASDVRTSFGSMVVGSAQALTGLTSKDLAGATHGIAGYVAPDQVQVQVTVEMTNRLRVPIKYSPSQFTLVPATGAPIEVRAASIKPSKLYPDAAVDATLVFVAPRDGQKLSLAFQDYERPTPFIVDLSHIDTAPKKGAADEHGHP